VSCYEAVFYYPDGEEHGMLLREPLTVGDVLRVDGIDWQVFEKQASDVPEVIVRFFCRPALRAT
jgi:hypothetical protein